MKDGGPAFPNHSVTFPSLERDRGMSLRDYFAAAALTGIVVTPSGSYLTEAYAERAYRLADAMLAEREKNVTG